MQELSKNAHNEPEGRGARPMGPDMAMDADVEELREELGKWQARVPKLAAALRERTQEAERLQAQLDALASPDPGTQARDDLIAELEAKLGALSSKHQDLQGQLHSRDMEINGLRQDVSDWKTKWQSVTRALDDQAAQAVTKDAGLQGIKDELAAVKETLKARTGAFEDQEHELQMLRDEAESLGKRNAQLFETTDLANRQIETLGDSLSGLRERVGEKEAQLAEANVEAAALSDQLASRDAQLQRLDGDIDALHTLVEAKQQNIQELETRVVEQASAREQTAALEASLAQAQSEMVDRDGQIQTLQQTMDDQAAKAQQALADQAARHQRAVDDRVAPLNQTIDEQRAKLAQLESRGEEQREELRELAAMRESQQQSEQAVESERQARESKIAELEARLNEEMREIARLESCVGSAEQLNAEREEERRAMSTRMKAADKRVKHLESQLEERSNLVMGLEREKTDSEQNGRTLRSDNEQLQDKLEKSERHATEHAEHITQLDSRLERQKDLMAKLEVELAGARVPRPAAESIDGADVPADSGEASVLRGEIQKLELMLRDRTEEMNKLRWQHDMAEQGDATAQEGDSKMLVVLNQQLRDSRETNERMSQKMRELETLLAQASTAGGALLSNPAGNPDGDDLTRIRGIGPKVAGQLNELGIWCFLQLAETEPEALDDVAHPLHALKKRIVKDAWIEQARRLELDK